MHNKELEHNVTMIKYFIKLMHFKNIIINFTPVAFGINL